MVVTDLPSKKYAKKMLKVFVKRLLNTNEQPNIV